MLKSLAESHSLQPSSYLSMPVMRPSVSAETGLLMRSVVSDMVTLSMRVADGETNLSSISGLVEAKDDVAMEAVELDSYVDVEFVCSKQLQCPRHVAPLQMPLNGCSMWPSARKSVSFSLWLQVNIDEKDVAVGGDGDFRRCFSKGWPQYWLTLATSNAFFEAILSRTLYSFVYAIVILFVANCFQ
jgi:hypothetical protein